MARQRLPVIVGFGGGKTLDTAKAGDRILTADDIAIADWPQPSRIGPGGCALIPIAWA